MDSLENDVKLRALLERLHARSIAQEGELQHHLTTGGLSSVTGSDVDMIAGREFWRDKLVAIDRDKAQFCYRLCRAMGARTIVEIGTSYGVSTLYLAAAVRDNGGGTVVATEYEVDKIAVARRHFAEAGLSDQIDLREGDLRQTLRSGLVEIDFVLMDTWLPMVLPALEIVGPHLRTGGVIVTDNTESFREDYADLFAYLRKHEYTTQTLPFDNGLELSVKLA